MKVLLYILLLPLGLIAQLQNIEQVSFLGEDFSSSMQIESKVTAPVEIVQPFDSELEFFVTIEIYVEEILDERQGGHGETYIPKYLTTSSLFDVNHDFPENKVQERLDNLMASNSLDMHKEDTLFDGFKSASIYNNFPNLTGLANGFGPRITL